jgi:putative endonuclease
VVEQRTHKPLVAGSIPASGTNSPFIAAVYLLQSKSGRYYYGSTTDLTRRLAQHERGHTATTAKDGPWQLVASREFESLQQARAQERIFKRWKNPVRVLDWFGR